jgi:hypothetical protein
MTGVHDRLGNIGQPKVVGLEQEEALLPKTWVDEDLGVLCS